MSKPRMSRTRDEILDGVDVVGGRVWVTCHNCGGSGDYPSSMIPAGRCRLYCWQNRTPETYGKLPIDVDRYVRREQARDRREYHRAAEAESRAASIAAAQAEETRRLDSPEPRIAALVAALDVDLRAVLDGYVFGLDEFAASLLRQYVQKGSLSDAQWTWVVKLAERETERASERASRHPAPSGRAEVEGDVIKVAYKEPSGGWGGRWVMTVKTDAGWLAWGTVPRGIDRYSNKGLAHHPFVGDRVRFAATLSPSDDDACFAFFKRPAGGEILASDNSPDFPPTGK